MQSVLIIPYFLQFYMQSLQVNGLTAEQAVKWMRSITEQEVIRSTMGDDGAAGTAGSGAPPRMPVCI